jgi:Lectin C-type domain
MTMRPSWMLLVAPISMIACSAVLGLDEPTHREGDASSGTGGSGGAPVSTGTGGGDPDASFSSGSSGTVVVGNGGMSGGSATGGNGGASTAGGAGQGFTDAGRDAVADVGADGGPRCDDGKQNGNETAADCGGSCSGCANGMHCSVSGDCLSKTCTNNSCQRAACPSNNICVCKPGYVGQPNYIVCSGPADVIRSWDLAKLECEKLGAHLAKIDDLQKREYIHMNIINAVNPRFWVGASAPMGPTVMWRWLDGSGVAIGVWSGATPPMDASLRCGELSYLPSGLDAVACGVQLPYICEQY